MQVMIGLVLCLAVAFGARVQDMPGSRPSLASMRAWLKGKPQRQADLPGRLGPPERVELVAGSDRVGPLELTWEEDAWIRVFFRGGRARHIDGYFAAHAAGGALSLDTFHKLRPGMTRKAVEQLLGAPDEDRAFGKDTQRCEWARRSHLTVTLKRCQLGASEVGVRPALTKELRQWLEAGRGRLREADVFRKMGRPDLVFNPTDPDAGGPPADEIGMMWREQARIVVELRDGVATRLRGEFAPHARSARLTLENFCKLHRGMKDELVEDVLGPADDEARSERGVRRQTWVARQELVVYFRGGKVKSVTWWGPF